MADPPRLSPAADGGGGHRTPTTPTFVFNAPSTPACEREASPRPAAPPPPLYPEPSSTSQLTASRPSSTSQLTSSRPSSTSTSQPASPKMASPRPPSSSQPTSPKQSTLKAEAAENGALSPAPNASGSTGSATGNPRNKCALQPGHSLMDWIRLGNSGKDLAGVGGRLRAVSPADLATHNTKGDAWLAIRGRVYNITHYLPYHPGGPEELMRGAGADATQLFDKVHPWVNYESLLAKCLVGPLRAGAVSAAEFFGEPAPAPRPADRLREPSKAQELVRKSMENLANCMTPVRKRISPRGGDGDTASPSRIMQGLLHSSELPVTISRRAAAAPDTTADDKAEVAPPPPPPPPQLRYDWLQTSSRLTLAVYTRALGNPGARARLTADGALALALAAGDARAALELAPERALRHPLRLRVYPESGKVEVVAHKAASGVWASAGAVRWSAEGARWRRAARVRRRSALTHDTALLRLSCGEEALVVPVGHHVKVHCTIDGAEVVRSYTPVCERWAVDGAEAEAEAEAEAVSPGVCLVVKRYGDGALSPTLTALEEGAEVTLSGPYGNFDLQRLKRSRRVLLLAAGTGLTPMLSLLRFALERRNPRSELVHLMFFNKKEEDIILHDKLAELSRNDDRFVLTPVLSEAEAAWAGQRGRVSAALVRCCAGAVAACGGGGGEGGACAREHFAAACGPAEFTRGALACLRELGVDPECCHAFLG